MTTVVFTHANGMFAVFILILYCLFKISVWEIKKMYLLYLWNSFYRHNLIVEILRQMFILLLLHRFEMHLFQCLAP